MENYRPEQVLELWFPDSGHQHDPQRHAAFWDERMQGGMDAVITARFAGLTEAAAKGLLDHWADTPRGRLALLIALDQFPRSLWRDTPAAFAQDIRAARLAQEGIENGDFDELAPWEQTFFHIAILHCEGPDHLERVDRMEAIVERVSAALPEPISGFAELFRGQHQRVREIIARFGRHPHRNAVLGRISTPEEEAYIVAGDFPHVRKVKDDAAAS